MDTLSIICLCTSLIFVVGTIYINIKLIKVHAEQKNRNPKIGDPR